MKPMRSTDIHLCHLFVLLALPRARLLLAYIHT